MPFKKIHNINLLKEHIQILLKFHLSVVNIARLLDILEYIEDGGEVGLKIPI